MQSSMTTLNKPALSSATQTAAQPQPAEQAPQAPAPKPEAQTGLTRQDGFEAAAAPQQATVQRAAAQPAAPAPLAFDPTFQPLGAYQPAILQAQPAPVRAPATFDPTFRPLGAYEPAILQATPNLDRTAAVQPSPMAVARGALLQDQKFVGGIKSGTLFGDKEMMGKIAGVAKLAAPVADPEKPRDANDPTVGMTEAERAKYDALPPEQQARYDELHREACATTPPEQSVQALRDVLRNGEFGKYVEVENAVKDNPQAQADLQKLLFGGQLSERSDYLRTTLSYLHELATGQPPEATGQGVPRQELLAQLLQDLARPETMDQGDGNADCAGLAAAYGMATTDPAEYARIITTLAEKGKVNLNSPWGKALFGKGEKEEPAYLTFNPPLEEGRSPTQELFAEPWVDAATAKKDPKTQRLANIYGLNGQEFVDSLNWGPGVNGGGWKAAYMPPRGDPERAQAEQDAQKLLEGASEENPVYALINGHWVSVTGVKDGVVTYQDGRGRERTMSLDKFMRKLNTVAFQNGTVPESMDNPAHGKRGGGGNPRGGVDGIGN